MKKWVAALKKYKITKCQKKLEKRDKKPDKKNVKNP